MSVSSEHESNCLGMLNEMLGRCGVTGKLESIEDITSDVFVLLHETLLEDPLLDVIRNPRTLEDEAQNCQTAIDALSFDILKIHLNHVRGEDIVLGDKLAMCNLIEIYFVLLQQLDSEAEFTSDELSNNFVSAADGLPLLPSDGDIRLGKTSQQPDIEGSPGSKMGFSPALPPTTPQQRGKAPVSESTALQTDKKVQFPTPAIEPRIKPRCAIKAQSALDSSPEESLLESKQGGATYTAAPLYDIAADDNKPPVMSRLISVQTSDKSDTESANLAQTLARQIHASASDRPYLDYELKYNTFPAGHSVPEIGHLGMFEDITSTSGEDANYVGFASRSLRGKKRLKPRPKKTIRTAKDRPKSAPMLSKTKATIPPLKRKIGSKPKVDTSSAISDRSISQRTPRNNEEGKGRTVQSNVKPFVNKGKGAKSSGKKNCRDYQFDKNYDNLHRRLSSSLSDLDTVPYMPHLQNVKTGFCFELELCKNCQRARTVASLSPRRRKERKTHPKDKLSKWSQPTISSCQKVNTKRSTSKHDHSTTDETLPTKPKQSSSGTTDKENLTKTVLRKSQENLLAKPEPNNERPSSSRRGTYTIVSDKAQTTGELENEVVSTEVSTEADSKENLKSRNNEEKPHQVKRKQKTKPQISVLYPRARTTTTKERRRSASASPSVGRRNLSRDGDFIKKDQLSLMMDDFPFLHMSPSTLHRLYQDQSRHLEAVKRITYDTAAARRKAKRIMDEAEYREVLLSRVLHREQKRNANIQARKLSEAEQRSARNRLREHRQQSARLHHYYDEYQVRLRAKMQKQKTREEMMFKRLFNEALKSEKERLSEMRKYAKYCADERNRMKVGHGIITLYHDQLAMLADRVADERERLVLREKAEVKAMNKMKADLRKSLEAEIRDLQEQIVTDAHDTHFRELDMDVAQERLRFV